MTIIIYDRFEVTDLELVFISFNSFRQLETALSRCLRMLLYIIKSYKKERICDKFQTYSRN